MNQNRKLFSFIFVGMLVSFVAIFLATVFGVHWLMEGVWYVKQ